ncbi:MAG TPA: hypothetical protein PLK28_12725 [Candidatus Rifleibacterium sp.]|nr:hypothetical protein [Candidatus Rifleibacterium sp.]
MFNQGRKVVFLFLALAIISSFFPVRGAETASGTANAGIADQVIMAFQIERIGDFLSEPGNNPYEILRRLGRAINKDWPAGQNDLKAASFFNPAAIGTPDFLKPQSTLYLTTGQKQHTEELLSGYAADFDKLLAECRPASQALVIKMACESKNLKEVLRVMTVNPDAAKKLKPQQLYRIENQIIPMLDASDYLVGAAVISLNGFFGRVNIVSNAGNLGSRQIEHNLTIGDFINEDSLMLFAQTHPIEDPAETMKNIRAVPQSDTIIQMVASAGLDFEKDILANTARESVLYVNLDPTGDGGLPDVRFAAPVPEINKLRENLDKLKTLCMQTGIFTQIMDEDKISLVKLSYFMFPQISVYAGLAENFLVLATGKKNLMKEISHILNVKAGKAKGARAVKDLKRFWKVKFADFNNQLQRFLQSPLLRDKGIPPVSNLKFLEDFGELEIQTKASEKIIEFIADLPINKQ